MRANFKIPQLTRLVLGLAILIALLANERTPPAFAADNTVSLTAIAGGGTHRLPSGAFTTNSNCRTGVDTKLNEEYRIALEFDLASLPPSAEIHTVTLRLRAGTPDSAGTTAIYGYAGNGTIEASDMTAGSLAATYTPASPSPEFIDVTAAVLERWNNGQRWAGFSLRQEPLGSTYGSWDCPNNGNPPLLTIEYSAPDSTPPVITPSVVGTAGANNWYISNVSVNWSVVDNESAISNQSGCEAQTVTSDTRGVTFTCAASSGGGSSSQSVTIQRDATAPTIAFVNRTAANSNGWNNGDVTVEWRCSDTTSDVVAANVSQTVSGEGANQSVTGTCTDKAGNSATNTQSGINIDKTAPTSSAAPTSTPNTNGWYNSNVTIHFTCADNLSTVANCPADQVLSNEGNAVASTAQTVTDKAGNQSAASNVVTVQIDQTAPVVAVTGVSNGATYTLGSVPTAGCSTTDALSNVATQATLSITGGNADGTGSYTATCRGATDKAGNSGSASVTYSVAYKWTGFFQPVDNPPTVNTVNAGQAIPVKFSLGGNFGLNIFASGYPTSQKVSCSSSGSGGGASPIDQTATASNSSLQYDAKTQTYTYVWKTDKTWAGTCRTLMVKLIDGTTHTAFFQFNGKVSGAAVDGEVAVTQRIFLPLVNR